ncbi:ABC transporter permease [Streptomyces iconiensis]|uniref:ABC transporter permease n=1 Tax=Streptomyces iconiensis TaxID=1384038 RepID=A0ABT6ZZ61_9ACTN|nr:ABC transporter permease [Streptomyces iconiensis]MDJ1133916.1 ABC transporter permease [Streptomyces iconiensis]
MISVATVRERWTSFLGSFVAVALGVTVVTLSGLILLSGGTGVPERLAGAPVLVHSPAGERVGGVFAENPPWAPERVRDLRRTLEALPGVRAAVPDRSFYAQLTGTEQRKGDRQGHGWSSAALASYGLTAGTPPRADSDLVLDRALGHGPGDRVSVLTAEGARRFTVTGTVDGPGLYVTDRRAAQLAGGVRTIGLLLETGPGTDTAGAAGPAHTAEAGEGARTAEAGKGAGAAGATGEPGAAGVARAARAVVGGEGTVLTGAARDALAPQQDEMTRWIGGQVLTAMALLSTFVTVFIVSSAFAFTVAQRRREFGLLRTIGATPRQLRRMLYGEALTVGALGAAAGAVAGVLLAPAVAGVLVEAGLQPEGFAVRTRWWVPLAALVLGVAVALAGVWSASRRAARVAPLEAMREAAVDSRPVRRRLFAGLATTAAGLGCAVGTAFAGSDSMVLLGLGTAMGLTAGLTLLVPALLRPVVGALTRPLARRRGATGLLVRENMLTAVRRTAATVAPVLATVTFAVLLTSTVQTTQSADTARRAAAVRAEAAVAPHGTPGLSEAATAGMRDTAPLGTTVYGGEGRAALNAAGVGPGYARLTSGPVPRAGTAVVSRAVASAHGWRAGARATLTFEDGRTVRLRVSAVAAVLDTEGPYQLLLPRGLVSAHDPSALADVAYRTSGEPVRADTRLGLREVSLEDYAALADEEEDRLIRLFTLLLVAMTAGYTAVAVASTLLAATADRARDFRVLRLSGATPRQVLAAVAGETVCVVALGATLGLAAVVPALLGMVHGLRDGLGVPVELTVAWPWVGGAVGGCLVLGLLAAVLPARAALRSGGRSAGAGGRSASWAG